MPELSSLLTPSRIAAGLVVANKKALFQQLGTLVARSAGVDAQHAAERLAEREKLGSTGFGAGVAIPHGKIAGLREVVGVFARLDRPIDFDAIDQMPVDLVFALFSPIDAGAEHLKALAGVSRQLRDKAFVAKLRGAGSPDALVALLAGFSHRDAA